MLVELEPLNRMEPTPLYYLLSFIKMGILFLILLFLGFSIYYLIHIGNQTIENRKRINITKKHFCYFLLIVIVVVVLFILYGYRSLLWKLFVPITWSVIFAYLINPIVHILDNKGLSRLWSVTVVYCFIILLISLVFMTITPKVTNEGIRLMELMPKYTNDLSAFLNKLYGRIEQLDSFSPQLGVVKESITEALLGLQRYILRTIKEITSGLLNIFTHMVTLLLIPIFTFYFLKDTDYFKKKLKFVIPKVCRNECSAIFRDIDRLLSKFIRGQLIVATCVGILSTLALLILKVDFAFIIGMIAGISNVIPYFGPIIGAIPGVLFALLDEPSKAVWVVITFTAIQQIESAILSPKIVGESVGIHPIFVILILLIGNEWFGIVGMLFSVPVAASMKIIIRHLMDLIIKG